MQTTRRGILAWGAMAALGLATGTRRALGGITVGKRDSNGNVLVTVFLRGGADGLNVVVPYGDHDYYKNRPTLGIAAPTDQRAASKDRALDLNGFHALHPALAPLLPLYHGGQMAVIPACGSGDETRSHFQAMATMERGGFGETGAASGWLARHLQSAPWENSSPLRAVALGAMVPDSLRGANATALRSVNDLRLSAPFADKQLALTEDLHTLYGSKDLLGEAGHEALSVLKRLQSLAPEQTRPALGASYPKGDIGDGLRQVALLIKAGVGLETACLDDGNYDSHVAQGGSEGYLANLLRRLAGSLAAFAADLGPAHWAKTTIIVQSEFGRRVEENSGAGTDHGHAGVMLVLGGSGIQGGKVHGVWPGLSEAKLTGPGDLVVTTDYRNVLAEVLSARLGNSNATEVFPGLAPSPVGVAVHG